MTGTQLTGSHIPEKGVPISSALDASKLHKTYKHVESCVSCSSMLNNTFKEAEQSLTANLTLPACGHGCRAQGHGEAECGSPDCIMNLSPGVLDRNGSAHGKYTVMCPCNEAGVPCKCKQRRYRQMFMPQRWQYWPQLKMFLLGFAIAVPITWAIAYIILYFTMK